jgi:hypothetical protein
MILSRVKKASGGMNTKNYDKAEEARIHKDMHAYFERDMGVQSAYNADRGIKPMRPANYGRKGT